MDYYFLDSDHWTVRGSDWFGLEKKMNVRTQSSYVIHVDCARLNLSIKRAE